MNASDRLPRPVAVVVIQPVGVIGAEFRCGDGVRLTGGGVREPHVTSDCVLRLLSVLPAGLFPFCAGVPAIGVGQPATNCAAVCGAIPP